MEIAVIAIIALIVLGPNKLPEAAKSLGKGFREMRDSFQGAAGGGDHEFDIDEHDESDEDSDVDEKPAAGAEPKAEPATASADEAGAHQNEARSSVPSASSSSTERE